MYYKINDRIIKSVVNGDGASYIKIILSCKTVTEKETYSFICGWDLIVSMNMNNCMLVHEGEYVCVMGVGTRGFFMQFCVCLWPVLTLISPHLFTIHNSKITEWPCVSHLLPK